MTAGSENKSVLRCVFCGKHLDPDQIVRFRGAISCEECAKKAEAEHPLKRSPLWFWLAVPGALIAAIGSMLCLKVVWTYPSFVLGGAGDFSYSWYGQAVLVLGIGLAVTSLGFIGLYRNYDRPVGLLLAASCLVNGVTAFAFYWASLMVDPLAPIEETSAIIVLSLEAWNLTQVLSILFIAVYLPLTRDDHGSDAFSVAPSPILLLAVGISSALGPFLLYALLALGMVMLAVFFVTAKSRVPPSEKKL